jgi:hypothetical protein
MPGATRSQQAKLLDAVCNVLRPHHYSINTERSNALVFLYKRFLKHALQGSIAAVRADRKRNVPVVITREEVATVISLMDGTAQSAWTRPYPTSLSAVFFGVCDHPSPVALSL